MAANLKQECLSCEKSFSLQAPNTVIHLFTGQPWFSFAEAICPYCHNHSQYFFGPDYADWIQRLQKLKCGVLSQEFASDELIKEWEKMYGVRSMKEHKLTPRMELELAHLHQVLENIPDELLSQLMTDPAPLSTMPERWI